MILDFIINTAVICYGIKKSREYDYKQYTGKLKNANIILNEKARAFIIV